MFCQLLSKDTHSSDTFGVLGKRSEQDHNRPNGPSGLAWLPCAPILKEGHDGALSIDVNSHPVSNSPQNV